MTPVGQALGKSLRKSLCTSSKAPRHSRSDKRHGHWITGIAMAERLARGSGARSQAGIGDLDSGVSTPHAPVGGVRFRARLRFLAFTATSVRMRLLLGLG